MFKRSLVSLLLFFIYSNTVIAEQPGSQNFKNIPSKGIVNWSDWDFEYKIENNDMQGLVLSQVKYKNTLVISKASLPVVRVKYKGKGNNIASGCGPFADKFYSNNFAGLLSPALHWETIKPYNDKASEVVSIEGTTSSNNDYFGIFVYAEIGGYKLWHGWNFLKNGQIEPIMYSSGWSCRDGIQNNDHRHHAYWRIDFDLEDEENSIWEISSGIPRKIYSEENLTRLSKSDLNLLISTENSKKIAILKLSKDNQLADSPGKPWFGFSGIDLGIRLFKENENNGWEFGAKGELGHISTPEIIDAKDTVIWVAGHLGHDYVPGKDDENHIHWHWTGPIIKLENF